MASEPKAVPAPETIGYRSLERPHRWRRQWFLKGRNMTVGQLVYSMRARGLLDDPEAAARDFDLPVEQALEALDYFRRYRDLIEAEADEEKRWLIEAAYSVEPRPCAAQVRVLPSMSEHRKVTVPVGNPAIACAAPSRHARFPAAAYLPLRTMSTGSGYTRTGELSSGGVS